MPDQLYSLTLFELNSLIYHHYRATREQRYTICLPHFDKDQAPDGPEDWYKLPGDPGWKPPDPEPSLEEHIEFMRKMDCGGPTDES